MNRRNFLSKTGYTLGASSLLPALSCKLASGERLGEWEAIRQEFLLTTDKIQMAQFLLASHPTKVRNAIRNHRDKLDGDTAEYFESNFLAFERNVIEAAAKYLEASPDEIALTDSTTMGLALLYGGLDLKPGDEILTTSHDHFSTEKSLEYAARNTGAKIRRINLYEEGAETRLDYVLSTLEKSILAETRIVAVTYVHSGTGVKLPIKEMAAVIKKINEARSEADRIYFCVDGVHAFGVEDISVADLGCDFLVAGTHKWLFGPRGTGIIWAKKDAWHMVNPTIPPFSVVYAMWMNLLPEGEVSFHSKITPGGFHSFEYRWSLKEAFEFHLEVGKEKIEKRTHELNTMFKEGVKNIAHVKLHTPISPTLSAGINCFEVEGMKPAEVVKKLHEQNIIGSTTPYKTVYARLTPCITNTEEEVRTCIRALEQIKS